MLVDFNTAIQTIRNANLDMVELINKWKELLSTNPGDVEFTFADGSSVSFPNVAKLISQYGSFPYNELQFKVDDNDAGTSYHMAQVNPEVIQVYRYTANSGGPSPEEYVKMSSIGDGDPYIEIASIPSTAYKAKITTEQVALTGPGYNAYYGRESAKLFAAGNKIVAELKRSSLDLTDINTAGTTKTTSLVADSFEQKTEVDNKKYIFKITKDEFFYGMKAPFASSSDAAAGLKITRTDTDSDRYKLDFSSYRGYGAAQFEVSDDEFSYTTRYQTAGGSIKFNPSNGCLEGGNNTYDFSLGAGVFTFSSDSLDSPGAYNEIKIDSAGIYVNDVLKVPFTP